MNGKMYLWFMSESCPVDAIVEGPNFEFYNRNT